MAESSAFPGAPPLAALAASAAAEAALHAARSPFHKFKLLRTILSAFSASHRFSSVGVLHHLSAASMALRGRSSSNVLSKLPRHFLAAHTAMRTACHLRRKSKGGPVVASCAKTADLRCAPDKSCQTSLPPSRTRVRPQHAVAR